MKKILLVAFGLILFTQASYSQLQIGLRAGLNISKIVGSDIEDSQFLLGPHGGAFLRVNASEKFIFQPEVLFSMKGERYTYSSTKYTQRLNYVDVPLMIGYKPIKSIGILLGVQPSVLVGAKFTTDYKGKKVSESGTEGLNKFDFGVVAGLQFQTESGIDFGARLNYGFLGIAEDDGFSETSVRNMNIMITFGYAFGGK